MVVALRAMLVLEDDLPPDRCCCFSCFDARGLLSVPNGEILS